MTDALILSETIITTVNNRVKVRAEEHISHVAVDQQGQGPMGRLRSIGL